MKLSLALAGLLGLATISIPGDAQGAAPNLSKLKLAGSTHDIGKVGCKGCHAPHNGNGSTTVNTGQLLLWSQSFTTASAFGVYDTPTVVNKAAELAGTTVAGDVRMYSLLCLSCHDGISAVVVNAVNKVGSKASFGGGAPESFGLTNDHPVNLTYPASGAGLDTLVNVGAKLPLYGTAGNSLQCATCHDPHSDENTNYLRQANNTTHCTTCHL